MSGLPPTGDSITPSLIDVHSHFLPDWYVEEAVRGGFSTPDGMPAWPTWNADDHLRLMDDLGIGRSLLSLSTPGVSVVGPEDAPALAARVNDSAASVVARFPDRFGFLATLPLPDVVSASAEAHRALDILGASGVILQTHTHGTYLTDPGHDAVWAVLAERQVPVLLHPTSPPGWEATSLGLPRPMMEFFFDSARVVSALLLGGLLDRHPGLRLIVPHCGGVLPLLVSRVTTFQQGLRFLAPAGDPAVDATDVRDALGSLWWDLAGSPDEVAFGALAPHADRGRVVYGSDFCFTPEFAVRAQQDTLDRSWHTFCDSGSWRQVTGANAAELMG
ncbi:amidohydrolase family protein [Gordonia sp. HNM0687]|uniref:6-methylsalicylate decarboxylase n=1 Tax=Gordonia mangrovi TaxID=2665643 RepID=A0A6L7GPA9_9ACTN|nr:amidohydrolase family protein [Gordonia mangrovi]MXP21706.1 amidohydrolase family protein [Gordonia mangrovi]UVF80438.1 amidohydrolase [Gordonia mangrovi]